jgi:hypothetical protein
LEREKGGGEEYLEERGEKEKKRPGTSEDKNSCKNIADYVGFVFKLNKKGNVRVWQQQPLYMPDDMRLIQQQERKGDMMSLHITYTKYEAS